MIRPLDTAATGSQTDRASIALPASAAGRRLEHLTPVAHELIAWDLVYRSESGGFLLQEDVQRRLGDLLARQAQVTTRVYVGRPCARCGLVTTTRLVDDALMCAACSAAPVVPAGQPDPPRGRSPQSGRHDRRSHRHRRAS